MRKEVVKLKVKSFIIPDNVYDKYYIDIRESSNVLSLGDLRRIALREVAKLQRPTYKVDQAVADRIVHFPIIKPKDVWGMLMEQKVP
jgi:hypothetical protein